MVTTNSSTSGITFLSGFGDLGGNNFTSQHLSKFFNYDQPYNFGKTVTRRWASLSPLFYPKVLTSLTMVAGRTHDIDTPTFQWTVGQDVDRYFRFMEDAGTVNPLMTNDILGLNLEPFWIVLDVDWARTNSILSLEDNRYKLRVLLDPTPYGNFWKYKVECQTSNPNVFTPKQMISKGKLCMEAASVAAEYGNQNLPGVSMGTSIMYQNVIGMYGRECSVDERIMKKEIQARKYGKTPGSSSNQMRYVDPVDFSTGIAFKPLAKNRTTGEIEEIKNTAFISWAEAKIEELVLLDREYMMKYGEFMEKHNPTLGIIDTRMAPGTRALVHDGHVRYHSGDWTAQDFESYLMGIFLARVNQMDREIEAITGELGMLMFDSMLAIQYRNYVGTNSVIDSSFFLRTMKGGENWELEYGSQFKSFRARNGVKVTLRHDRMLDDPYYCIRRYVYDANYTVDSARFDFYDFGGTNSVKDYNGSNVCMITQGETEQVYWKIGRMNPYTGYLRGMITSEDTTAKYKRIITGSIQVWDTSRIGAIIYDPDYTT